VAGGCENIRDLDCGYGFGKSDEARQATTGGTDSRDQSPGKAIVMLVSRSFVEEALCHVTAKCH
jgi:hypothetical protein